MQDLELGNLAHRRHGIVRERAGQERAVIAVGIFLIDRRADGIGEAAPYLPVHHALMQDAAAVMHCHIAVDARLSCYPVDLDTSHTSKMKA